MLDLRQEQKEKQELFDKLSWAGIESAKNNGKGIAIRFTDYQIMLMRELVKEVLL